MEFLRRRREFITLLGGEWPLAGRAQQPVRRVPRIGVIDDAPRPTGITFVKASAILAMWWVRTLLSNIDPRRTTSID